MNFNNPFDDQLDTSFEKGMPVTQGAKAVSKAISSQVKKQTDDTVKKVNDDIVSALYGTDTQASSEDPGTDEANPYQYDNSNQAARMAAAQMSSKKTSNTSQNPEEEMKMKKIRAELFSGYSSKFHSAINGSQPLNTNLEMDVDKARKEREQQEMQRKQEEEEEEQRKKEEEEAKKQEGLEMPAGKKTGFMMGKKQQQPLAVQQARTKAEMNRGTTG